MRYLCTKQLTAGGETYYPGEIIPDGVILPERSGKLLRSGYISEVSEEFWQTPVTGMETLFTQEEVTAMIAKAVEEVEQKYSDEIAKLEEMEDGTYAAAVTITVKGDSDDQNVDVPATPEEIQRSFAILQMNAEEGVKAIADVKSENVLIIVHAIDNRKTVKEAAKKQADNLFSTDSIKNDASNGKSFTDTNAEGSDT